jgi:hypothetical protein
LADSSIPYISLFFTGERRIRTMSYSLIQQSDGGSTAVWVLALLWGVLMIVALWKVFTKAGQPGWAAIIPIYDWLVLLRVIGRPWWWLLLLLVPFVNIVVLIIMMLDLAKSFGRGVGFAIGLMLFTAIWGLILAFGSSKYRGPVAGPNAVAPAA